MLIQGELEDMPGYHISKVTYVPLIEKLSKDRINDFRICMILLSLQAQFEAEKSFLEEITVYSPVTLLGKIFFVENAYEIYLEQRKNKTYHPKKFIFFLKNYNNLEDSI